MTDMISIPLDAAAGGWVPWVAGVVTKGTLLLALVFAAAAVLRRTSASARHLVWSIGLVSVLALPLLSAATPWRLAVLPASVVELIAAPESAPAIDAGAKAAMSSEPTATRSEVERRSASSTGSAGPVATSDAARGGDVEANEAAADGIAPANAETGSGGAARDAAVPPTSSVEGGAVPNAAASTDAGGLGAGTGPALAGTAGAETSAAAHRDATSASTARSGADAGDLGATATVLLSLLALWMTGAFLLTGRVAAGSVALRRIARRAEPLTSSDWTTPYYEAADRLDLDRLPRLLMSDGVTLPFTYGLFRSTIVLPADASDWTDDRRRAVLLHELGHVRRFDLWSHLIGRIACALYWFHPLVWMAARRARAESERACDDLVLRTGTRASTYADHLLQIVRGARRSTAPAVAIPMAQHNEFEGRMLAILEPDVKREAPSRAKTAALVASVAAMTFAVAAMAPAPADGALAGEGPDDDAFAAEISSEEGAGEARERDATPRPDRTGPGEFPAPEAAAATESRSSAPTRAMDEAVDVASPGMDGAEDRPSGTETAWLGDITAIDLTDGGVPTDTPTTGDRRWSPAFAPRPSDFPHGMWFPDVDIAGITNDAMRAAFDAVESIDSDMIADAIDHGLYGLRAGVATPTPMPTPAPAPMVAGHDYDYDYDYDHGGRRRRDPADSATVRALMGALQDSEAEVRRIAAHTLGEIEDPAAVAALASALREDEDVEVRRTAAWALGEIQDPAAVPALGDALIGDTDASVRRMAAWALGEIEDVRALEALSTAASDADEDVAHRAVWAIGEIGAAEGAAALEPALAHPSAEVRRMAAWAYGELDTNVATPGLLDALRDESDDVRRMTAWALGEIEDPQTAGALVEVLGDENREVRRMALRALGEIGGPTARDALIQAIRSDDPEIRKMAARALASTY